MATLLPDELDSVEQILKGGKHLLNLINEILDVARIEARQAVPLAGGRAPAGSDSGSARLCASGRRSSATSESALFPRQRDFYVMADRQRLRQVLLNLLANGVGGQRGQPAGSKFPVELREKRRYPDCRLGYGARISPHPTGIGCSSPLNGWRESRWQRRGRALGLALSKGPVEAMGGAIGGGRRQLAGGIVSVSNWRPSEPPADLLPEISKSTLLQLTTMSGIGPTQRRIVLYIEDKPPEHGSDETHRGNAR